MTFEELEQKLPNGFHDAQIRSISVDFVGASVEIGLNLDVGTPGISGPCIYRSGRLTVGTICLFFVDAPDPTYPFLANGKPISATGSSLKIGEVSRMDVLLRQLPAETSAFAFFLDNWNSYIYVAGATLDFVWDDGHGFGSSSGLSVPKTWSGNV